MRKILLTLLSIICFIIFTFFFNYWGWELFCDNLPTSTDTEIKPISEVPGEVRDKVLEFFIGNGEDRIKLPPSHYMTLDSTYVSVFSRGNALTFPIRKRIFDLMKMAEDHCCLTFIYHDTLYYPVKEFNDHGSRYLSPEKIDPDTMHFNVVPLLPPDM